MKRILSLLLVLSLLLCLCACGKEEQSSDDSMPEPEAASLSAKPTEEAPSNLIQTDFSTDDGLIQVSIRDPRADRIPATMPVLRVRPKIITSDMARRMATGVFGDAEFYEYSEELSRDEIAERIAAWEEAVTDEAIFRSHGADSPQDWIDSVREDRLAILEYYRNAYAYARDEVKPVPCQWRFWPDEHYAIHGYDYAGTDPFYTDEIPAGLSVTLRAVATVDGISYEFWVSNNEREDFRNHGLSIFVQEPNELYSGTLSEAERAARQIEWSINTGLYNENPATEEELAAACTRAVQMAADMGLGDWQFSAEPLDKTGIPGGGWQIRLTGQPVYQGYPVTWRHPSRYPDFALESMTLLTNNDGTLVELLYHSPMEVVEVVEEAAPLKTWDELWQEAQLTMRRWSYSSLIPSYDAWQSFWELSGTVITDVRLSIDSVRVGYTRLPWEGEDFLLVPTVSFLGNLEVMGMIPGVQERPMELVSYDDGSCRDAYLVLDLRDGTSLR